MLFDELILQGADPGGNLGAAFVANIDERDLIPKDKYLHELVVGMKCDTAVAAVLMPVFLDLLNPFIVKAGQETRIQLRGQDLLALNMFLYGSVPLFFSADTIGDDAKIAGLRVPIWETIDSNQKYSWSATAVAQVNCALPVLEVAARWSDKTLMPNPIVAVELPFITGAALGRTALGVTLPKLGDLIGMILFCTTVPTNLADLAGVQRLQLYKNGERFSQYNMNTIGNIKGFNQDNQALLMQDVYMQYRFIDLRDDPIDAKANEIGIEIDNEAAGDPCRLIPIFLKK